MIPCNVVHVHQYRKPKKTPSAKIYVECAVEHSAKALVAECHEENTRYKKYTTKRGLC
jgi:hypothetical protein